MSLIIFSSGHCRNRDALYRKKIRIMKVAVSVKTFSKNPELVNELLESYPGSKVNSDNINLNGAELVDFIQGYEGIIIGLENIDEQILKSSSALKVISKYGVGLDNIDFSACDKYGIPVLFEKGVNKTSVAELTLGFLLALGRNIHSTCCELKSQIWNKSGGADLSHKTIGIVGVGNIGKEVIRLIKPFRCKILVNDIIDQTDYYKINDVEEVSKEKLLANSDFVSIHTPLNPEMYHFICKSTLSLMKFDSFLINTARGAIVNSSDLKWALETKVIKGAALDVYEEEPPLNFDLISMPNLICTPHIGGGSEEAVLAMGRSAINLLRSFEAENLIP